MTCRMSGRSAYYVEMLAKHHLIAIHTAASPRLVAPPGGIRPVYWRESFIDQELGTFHRCGGYWKGVIRLPRQGQIPLLISGMHTVFTSEILTRPTCGPQPAQEVIASHRACV